MLFGSCCFLNENRMNNMNTKSIKINGVQSELLVNFEIIQTFYHSEKEAKEVSYVFPNDLKICIYDTTFVVGEKIIKPKLQSKEEAKKTYKEAVDAGRTAIFGTNVGRGMTQFQLGNVPPNIECKVILKIAFTGQVTKERSFFIKFPIDVYTPSGPAGCLDLNESDFSFLLQCDAGKISRVISNVKNSKFDDKGKIFSISQKIENDQNEKAIIITFETKEKIKSSCLTCIADSSNFDCCALSILPDVPSSTSTNKEFIFVIDCSGSMDGNSIKKASECLEFFIKSLPSDSYFNVIRFGSNFAKLFETSVLYDDSTQEKAVQLAIDLKADLGGTDIYSPLKSIFSEKCEHGQRQIFIMTDGEVDNAEMTIDLVYSNSNENRCFTIGIGRGCDAGLVEGIANASGGMSDFVQENDSISDKVIPQLQSSLHSSVTSLEIHVEGEDNDSFEVSPFPLPPINASGSSVVYLRQKKNNKNAFPNNVLITGNYNQESIEIPVDETINLADVDEDEYGCSFGKNIGKAILPLFAFSILQKLERKKNISDDEKAKAIELSIQSGVLCKYTGYVGILEKTMIQQLNEPVSFMYSAPGVRFHRFCGGGGMRCLKRPILEECEEIRKCEEMQRKEYEKRQREHEERKRKEFEERKRKEYKERQREYEEKQREYEERKRKEFEEKQKEYEERQKRDEIGQQKEKQNCQKISPNAIHHEGIEESKELPSPKNKYDLITLTRHQKAGGYWDDLNAVQTITGIKEDQIDEINLNDKNIENYCLATIFAIAAMRVKSPGDKNSWIMIEQKALDWLKKTLPEVNIDLIISRIESLI
ncbi:von Willebrand factor A domain-containing protein 5A [Tritrichomonas musculus]|uniref:von Willebrand factor A domain-containing protein 5A n=1 Tax=Tritrichomonas musculus TaxID=1915356 RepID=A0ABR2KNX7_9EUKA